MIVFIYVFSLVFVLFICFFLFQVHRHLIRYFPLTIWLLINSFRLLIVLKFQRRLNIPHPLIRTPRPLTQQRTQHNEALFTALGATITWSDVQTPATDRPLCPRRLTSVRLNIRVYNARVYTMYVYTNVLVYKIYVYIQYICIKIYVYMRLCDIKWTANDWKIRELYIFLHIFC